MSDDLPAEEKTNKGKRARFRAPVRVTVTWEDGTTKNFGCYARRVDGTFLVLESPSEENPYETTKTYVRLANVRLFSSTEPAQQYQPPVPVSSPSSAPPPPSGPREYSARSSAAQPALKTGLNHGLPMSQVMNEDGTVGLVNVGFIE